LVSFGLPPLLSCLIFSLDHLHFPLLLGDSSVSSLSYWTQFRNPPPTFLTLAYDLIISRIQNHLFLCLAPNPSGLFQGVTPNLIFSSFKNPPQSSVFLPLVSTFPPFLLDSIRFSGPYILFLRMSSTRRYVSLFLPLCFKAFLDISNFRRERDGIHLPFISITLSPPSRFTTSRLFASSQTHTHLPSFTDLHSPQTSLIPPPS